MKGLLFVLFVALALSASGYSQNPTGGPSAQSSTAGADTKAKKTIFRASKDQIKQVQTMFKSKGLYSGEAIGKLDSATRRSIKSFQKDNGLAQTGTLNRATLEKMKIELTDAQKAIPISESSYAKVSATTGGEPKTPAADKPKRTIFRATKDQIVGAQKLLKSKSMYAGEETGKLDTATREGLKKFQAANGLSVTGTLNQVTLEKMGIGLTEKQRDAAATNK